MDFSLAWQNMLELMIVSVSEENATCENFGVKLATIYVATI